ncbi:MAG: 30S ribosomal protein S6 [Candidatus Aminicenantes bacterium]|nr:30S ribosomal protein S6 [Candidatus Aminicenantes bacterium]
MRQYETAFLVSPKLEEEEIKATIQETADIVSKKKGKIVKQDIWGKRKLAYPIKKHEEAYYVFFTYEGEADIPAELERRFKQSDKIIRYLTVKKSEKENIRSKRKKSKVTRRKTSSVEKPSPEVENEEKLSPEKTDEEKE